MSTIKDEFEFYFSLDEENDEGAFKFEKHTFNVIAVDEAGEQIKYDIDCGEDDDFEDKCEELESDYGVHDVGFSPDTQFYGFTTYEVEEENIAELVDKWKVYFESRGFNVTDHKVVKDFESE